MEIKVDIEEFRDQLTKYFLESDSPVVIMRHGDTVGYFIPARRKRSDADEDALKEAASRWQEILDAEGITEDEIVADFKQWRGQAETMTDQKRLVFDANILLRTEFAPNICFMDARKYIPSISENAALIPRKHSHMDNGDR